MNEPTPTRILAPGYMQVDEIPTVEPEPKLEKRDEHPSPLVGFAPVTADC